MTLSSLQRTSARLGRLLIVLIALLHGFASYANAVSSSHAPALWHHDHDAEGAGSHDAADHSHDKTSLPHGEPHAAPPSDQDRTAGRHHPPYPLLSFSFERPPRQLPLK